MSEQDVIRRTGNEPVTLDKLATDLLALGVRPSMVVLVHSSLSALGWVSGGAAAVVLALEQVLGPTGTLVMPAHSADLSDPAEWQAPPVPQSWWQPIRDTMPAFDAYLTPTRGIGVIAEAFRKQEGVLRSLHPQVSFSARGPQARYITDKHSLEYGLGEGSPLARIYELDGLVLLLGVTHENNTSLHLAEYRATWPGKKVIRSGAPILVRDTRQWVSYDEIDYCASDFALIGQEFEARAGGVSIAAVGRGMGRLIRQRQIVDFAGGWMCDMRC